MSVIKFIITKEIQMYRKPITGTSCLNYLGFTNKNRKKFDFLNKIITSEIQNVRCVFENIKIKNDQNCERWKYEYKRKILDDGICARIQ